MTLNLCLYEVVLSHHLEQRNLDRVTDKISGHLVVPYSDGPKQHPLWRV